MKNIFIIFILSLLAISCVKEEISHDNIYPEKTQPQSVIEGYEFDWENADYMPTHPKQSKIPVPWKGAGSIIPFFGTEIALDFKKIDGWTMLYNSFDPTSEAEIRNPYFILYNKYNGIIRLYLYVNTPFVSTSSYLQDGIAINSTGYESNLLNFCGRDIVDLNSNAVQKYSQIQRKHPDIAPLASYRWYMLQYELAYDERISLVNSNNIYFTWYINYFDISEITIEGKSLGDLVGTIGSSSQNNTTNIDNMTNLSELGNTGILNGIGISFLEDGRTDPKGENDLGVDKAIFNAISSGLKGAIRGGSSGISGAVVGFLSGVFSSTQDQSTPIQMSLKMQSAFSGVIGQKGALPSTPISLKVPGTNLIDIDNGHSGGGEIIGGIGGIIPKDSANLKLPLFGEKLGVLYFKPGATIETFIEEQRYIDRDPYDNHEYEYCSNDLHINKIKDYTDYIVFNPIIREEATIKIEQELYILNMPYHSLPYKVSDNEVIYIGETGHIDYGNINNPNYFDPEFAVRFIIQIKPNNGGKTQTIIKTLKIKEERRAY